MREGQSNKTPRFYSGFGYEALFCPTPLHEYPTQISLCNSSLRRRKPLNTVVTWCMNVGIGWISVVKSRMVDDVVKLVIICLLRDCRMVVKEIFKLGLLEECEVSFGKKVMILGIDDEKEEDEEGEGGSEEDAKDGLAKQGNDSLRM
ncbi:hypothetical protein Tco_1092902 [Tanacetum coccineum]|uniref:Uncharacterized protein n=1 Tax=Tanacetum coccineum TaxID=301880 RepID=A0ABQ5ICH4_9ASTR